MTLAGGLRLIVSQRLFPSADRSRMIAAVELLPGSIPLWNLIRESKTFQIPSLQQRGKGLGIIRLDDSIAGLVKSGRITLKAGLSACDAPDELEASVAGKPGRAPTAPSQPDEQKGPDPMETAVATKSLFSKAGSLFARKGNG
jgi:twitching motility protein PilT